MMRVYLVRHGESEDNKHNIHQSAASPLSEIGVDQARYVAHRFKRIAVDKVYCSTMVRAYHTAQIIAKERKLPLEKTALLREQKWPSEIEGLGYSDPKAAEIRAAIAEHARDNDWHYSDEENYADLFARARKAVDFLATRSESSIIALTHGTTLRTIVLTMMMETVTYEALELWRHFFVTKNTGITLCEFNQATWQLLSWNDHAHLG